MSDKFKLLLISVIVMLGFTVVGINAPPSGAHGWNEARYLLEWEEFFRKDASLKEFVGNYYINHFPLLLYLTYPLKNLNHFTLIAALRVLMLIFGILTIYILISYTEVTEMSIFRKRIAVFSLLSMPYFLYISRTIQLEAPQTMLLFLYVFLITLWEKRNYKAIYIVLSLLSLLAAVLIKYSSIFFIIYYYLLIYMSKDKSRKLLYFVLPVIMVIIPFSVYLISLYSHYGEKVFLDTLFGYAFGESGKATPSDLLKISFYGNTAFWLLWTSSLFIIFIFLKKRESTYYRDEYFLIIFLIYYLFYHKHDYYLQIALPFIALAVARRITEKGFFKILWLVSFNLGLIIYLYIFSFNNVAGDNYLSSAKTASMFLDENTVLLVDRPQTLYCYKVLNNGTSKVLYKPRWDKFPEHKFMIAVFLERFHDKKNIENLLSKFPKSRTLCSTGQGKLIVEKEKLHIISIEK
ncbi:MAG: hypothetical protein JXA60_12770 [Candidatus Coatesbacteria bacterium]|nr:hypothetical protein [Candidatus Coatesbacteria bacterium]